MKHLLKRNMQMQYTRMREILKDLLRLGTLLPLFEQTRAEALSLTDNSSAVVEAGHLNVYHLQLQSTLYRMPTAWCSLLTVCVFGTLASRVGAQGPMGAGIAPFSTVTASQYDTINLANGALTFSVPIKSKPGPYPTSFVLTGSTTPTVGNGQWAPGGEENEIGWFDVIPGGPFQAGGVGTTLTEQPCQESNGATGQYYSYVNPTVTDISGAIHPVLPTSGAQNNSFYTDCQGISYPALGSTFYTDDGSGYTLVLIGPTSSQPGAQDAPTFNLYDRSGNLLHQDNTAVSPSGVTLLSMQYSSSSTRSLATSNAAYTDAYGEQVLKVNHSLAYSSTRPYSYPSSATFSYLDSVGQTQQASMSFGNLTSQTNFQCPQPRPTEWPAGGAVLPTGVSLPNGRAYSFTYESTPGFPNNTTERLQSIGLPGGGSITYTYTGGESNTGMWCDTAFGPTSSSHAGIVPIITRTINDGSGHKSVWTYQFTDSQTPVTTVTDPNRNDTVYHFVNGYQSKQETYQGSVAGKVLLRTVVTCYNGNSSNCATNIGFPSAPYTANRISQTDVYTSYDGGATSSVEESILNVFGLPTEVKEFDFGVSMPPTGNPLRDTVTTYGSWNGTNCASLATQHTNDRVCEVTIYGVSSVTGSYGTISDTKSSYDTNGNLTQSIKSTDGSNTVSESYTYDANGVLRTITDGRTIVTTYTNGACNGLLPTMVARGGLSTQQTWDCNGAVVTSSTGANSGDLTSYTYADPLYRLTKIVYPDQATRTLCYSDVGGTCSQSGTVNTVSSTTTATGSPDSTATSTSDGIGRTIKTVSADGSSVDTTYDPTGNVTSVSAAYVAGQSTLRGVTSYVYDAIGRLTYQCQPDNMQSDATLCQPKNSYQQYTYNGNQTTFYDELRNSWVRTSDGLGRLTRVVEPGNLPTSYAYDGLGNLISVTQSGTGTDAARTRNFTYDYLSRVVTASNPESGSVCYGQYASNGSGGQSCTVGYDGNSNLVAKTDARKVVTTYSYDSLDRLTAKHSGSLYASAKGLSSCFIYDTYASATPSNALGRLTAEWTQPAACPTSASAVPTSGIVTSRIITQYDIMGRSSTEQSCVLNSCASPHTQTYSYDHAGHTTAYTDGIGGNTFTQAYDATGRLLSLTSSLQDTQHPANLFTITTYEPSGWTAASIGGVMKATQAFDIRQRITTHTVKAGAQ